MGNTLDFKTQKRELRSELPRAVGLLAGWGEFPLIVAEEMRRQGHRVITLGIRDHADPQLAQISSEFHWIGLGSVGRAIRKFRRRGVQQAVMAGKVHKVMLLKPGWWLNHRPDWKCIKAFYPQLLLGTSDRRDDTLLSTLVDTFRKDGIEICPPTDFAPELLADSGHLGGRAPSSKQIRDAEFGFQIAKQMGGLDIGQCVCVKDRTVIAVEAVEGTDLCIRRAGELCPSGGFTVVKVAKPQQDMRFDVPTVGTLTLETIARAGGSALAIEGHRTIVLRNGAFLAAAKQLKITVMALGDQASRLAA